MKSYEEVTKDLLARRDRYVARQRENRKRLTGILTAMGCFSLVAVLGWNLWQEGIFPVHPSIPTNDNPPLAAGESGEGIFTGTYWVPGESVSGIEPGAEQTESSTPLEDAPDLPTVVVPPDLPQSMFDPCEHIPSITVDGEDYLQFASYTGTYTPGQCLGDLQDFEGAYQSFWSEVTGKLYRSAEDPTVLVLVFGDGSTAPLFKAD